MQDTMILQLETAFNDLLKQAKLKNGNLVVIGCSSSEIIGEKIGTAGSENIGRIVFQSLWNIAKQHNLYIAAQCCEHLNRALILEEEAAEKYGYEIVNVVPHPHAGGSFAAAAYQGFEKPVAVERIYAHAGMDIGGTFIGMHLKEVVVPVRSSISKIGQADILLARTRPKYVGGERAVYNLELG